MRRRTLTGCWLTARRVVALKLKILIQVVLQGPNCENTKESQVDVAKLQVGLHAH